MTFRIRDPVHNFIQLSSRERGLVDTPTVQRLRRIRQLAMANLVYPGALHTRFDHTLGVAHVAELMAKQLELDESERELVKVAALLHDVGHGPFSHVSEYALEIFGKRDVLGASKKEKIHEIITARIISDDPSIGKCLDQNHRDRIVRLLSSGWGKPSLRSIVSGPLDADKQDYLLRDSRFCGVEYGAFDLHQLHRSLRRHTHEGEDRLVVRQGALHAVEQFALAKYYMTCDVYRHKVRLVSDQMIVRAIVAAIDVDDNQEMRQLFEFDGTDDFIANYLQWDDSRFLRDFSANADSACGKILDRLLQRRLLKRVFHLRLDGDAEIGAEARDWVSRISEAGRRDQRRQFEQSVAESLRLADINIGNDDDLVIAHAYSIKSAREMARNDEADILVETERGIRDFQDASTLFASIQTRFNESYLDVFVPVEWDNHEDRNRILKRAVKPVCDAVESQTALFAKEVAA